MFIKLTTINGNDLYLPLGFIFENVNSKRDGAYTSVYYPNVNIEDHTSYYKIKETPAQIMQKIAEVEEKSKVVKLLGSIDTRLMDIESNTGCLL